MSTNTFIIPTVDPCCTPLPSEPSTPITLSPSASRPSLLKRFSISHQAIKNIIVSPSPAHHHYSQRTATVATPSNAFNRTGNLIDNEESKWDSRTNSANNTMNLDSSLPIARLIFDVFDPLDTGYITLDQMCDSIAEIDPAIQRNQVIYTFKLLDSENKGRINYEQFEKQFGLFRASLNLASANANANTSSNNMSNDSAGPTTTVYNPTFTTKAKQYKCRRRSMAADFRFGAHNNHHYRTPSTSSIRLDDTLNLTGHKLHTIYSPDNIKVNLFKRTPQSHRTINKSRYSRRASYPPSGRDSASHKIDYSNLHSIKRAFSTESHQLQQKTVNPSDEWNNIDWLFTNNGVLDKTRRLNPSDLNLLSIRYCHTVLSPGDSSLIENYLRFAHSSLNELSYSLIQSVVHLLWDHKTQDQRLVLSQAFKECLDLLHLEDSLIIESNNTNSTGRSVLLSTRKSSQLDVSSSYSAVFQRSKQLELENIKLNNTLELLQLQFDKLNKQNNELILKMNLLELQQNGSNDRMPDSYNSMLQTSVQEHNKTLQSQLNHLQKDIKYLKIEYEDKNKLCEIITKTNQQLETEIEKLTEEKEQINKLTVEVNKLKSSESTAIKQSKDQLQIINQYKSTIHQQKTRLEELEEEIHKQNQYLSDRSPQTPTSKASINTKQRRKNPGENLNAELELEEAQETIRKLKEELEQTKLQIKAVQHNQHNNLSQNSTLPASNPSVKTELLAVPVGVEKEPPPVQACHCHIM